MTNLVLILRLEMWRLHRTQIATRACTRKPFNSPFGIRCVHVLLIVRFLITVDIVPWESGQWVHDIRNDWLVESPAFPAAPWRPCKQRAPPGSEGGTSLLCGVHRYQNAIYHLYWTPFLKTWAYSYDRIIVNEFLKLNGHFDVSCGVP